LSFKERLGDEYRVQVPSEENTTIGSPTDAVCLSRYSAVGGLIHVVSWMSWTLHVWLLQEYIHLVVFLETFGRRVANSSRL